MNMRLIPLQKMTSTVHFMFLHLNSTLRGLILICSLLAIAYLLQITQFGGALNEVWIDTAIRNNGVTGELLFVTAGALFTAVGLPRQIIAFLAGYAFGFLWGCVLALFCTLLGCVMAFYYARALGKSFVTIRFPRSVTNYANFLHNNILMMTLLIRLLPVGSNLVTNLIAGVLRVSSLSFFVGSALGYIPQTVVFALIGSGVNFDPQLRISIGVLLFIISGMLGVGLFRKYRHKKAFSSEFEHKIRGSQARDGN